jgi:hypothetical protein
MVLYRLHFLYFTIVLIDEDVVTRFLIEKVWGSPGVRVMGRESEFLFL